MPERHAGLPDYRRGGPATRYTDPLLRRKRPRTFREFVEAPLFKGLGEKLSDIERLIADDAESLVRLRELVVAGRGGNNGNQYTKAESGKADNVSIATDLFVDPEPAKKKADAGNSRAAERPARPQRPAPMTLPLPPADVA